MTIEIRQPIAADYELLRAIDDAVMRYSARSFLGFDWDRAAPEEQEEQRAITPDAFAFYVGTGCSRVALAEGQIAGYALAQPLRHFDLEPLAIWVEDISVHPDWHRRGIATALYHDLGALAREMGATVILAGIHAANAASLAMHRRVGFDIYTTKTAVWRLQ